MFTETLRFLGGNLTQGRADYIVARCDRHSRNHSDQLRFQSPHLDANSA
jgi:hypothetical protein